MRQVIISEIDPKIEPNEGRPARIPQNLMIRQIWVGLHPKIPFRFHYRPTEFIEPRVPVRGPMNSVRRQRKQNGMMGSAFPQHLSDHQILRAPHLCKVLFIN